MLRKKANLCFDARVVDIQSKNLGRAPGREHQPHQQLQGSCFPGAIRSEIAEHFALINFQRERTQSDPRSLSPKANRVGFLQIRDRNSGRWHALAYPRGMREFWHSEREESALRMNIEAF